MLMKFCPRCNRVYAGIRGQCVADKNPLRAAAPEQLSGSEQWPPVKVCDACLLIHEGTTGQCAMRGLVPGDHLLRASKEEEIAGKFKVKVCPECLLLYRATAEKCARHPG